MCYHLSIYYEIDINVYTDVDILFFATYYEICINMYSEVDKLCIIVC